MADVPLVCAFEGCSNAADPEGWVQVGLVLENDDVVPVRVGICRPHDVALGQFAGIPFRISILTDDELMV